MGHYILDQDRRVIEVDTLTWAQWFETADRVRVALSEPILGATVSTVFLGLDHNWGDSGPPLVFETLVQYEERDFETTHRYATWEEAQAGHQAACWAVVENLVGVRSHG